MKLGVSVKVGVIVESRCELESRRALKLSKVSVRFGRSVVTVSQLRAMQHARAGLHSLVSDICHETSSLCSVYRVTT